MAGTVARQIRGCGFENGHRPRPVFFFLLKKVEGDGTLVPPTEDEVLQIEQFLDDKVDLPSIDDVGNVEDFFTNDCMLLKEPDFEGDVSIFIQFELLQCYIISF